MYFISQKTIKVQGFLHAEPDIFSILCMNIKYLVTVIEFVSHTIKHTYCLHQKNKANLFNPRILKSPSKRVQQPFRENYGNNHIPPHGSSTTYMGRNQHI